MPNLILSRCAGDAILIGEAIQITLLEIKGGVARFSIEAPANVRIVRAELKASDAEAPDKVPQRQPLVRHKQRKLPK